MLKQKFQIGDRVTTPLARENGDKTIWVIDKVELRVKLGEESHIVYSIRKLNSYDDDPYGICCSFFTEYELVGIPTEED